MSDNKPTHFVPAKHASTEERVAHALEFIAASMLAIEQRMDELTRDSTKIARAVQTKLK